MATILELRSIPYISSKCFVPAGSGKLHEFYADLSVQLSFEEVCRHIRCHCNDGLYIYNNTAMAVCSISLSGSASIPKNNVSPQNGIYLTGTPIPVINLEGPLSNSNFYLLNAPTGNVIYNQAEMDRSDFVTQVAKFSLSSGSLTVDEEGTYAVKQ